MKEPNQEFTSKALAKILELTENSEDGWKYVQYYRSLPKEQFAIVYPDVESVLYSWDSLLYDLRILWELELYPILILHSHLPGYIKQFLRPKFLGEGFFPIQFIRKPKFLLERIQSIIYKNQKIPILLIQKPLEDTFDFLLELIDHLSTRKWILIRERAGIWTQDNQRISILSLKNNDRDPNLRLEEDDQKILNWISKIFENIQNRRLTISVTSSASLLKELFTVKGSGTLIKKGNTILHAPNLENVDKGKIIELVESAFGKKCNQKFIESLQNPGWEIIYESNYQGCALFLNTSWGQFLSKFAVDAIARGEGIGREIWELMKSKYEFVFWRSKLHNPIASWYRKQASGMVRTREWYYFWLHSADQILPQNLYHSIIQYLQNLPEDWQVEKIFP